jgi:predicted nucleic-acid-binding Zn-ribbon protein
MSECAKCGGEMVRGEAYVDIETPSENIMMSPVLSPATAMGREYTWIPQQKRINWREKTGEKKGFLIKSDEIRTLVITGKRCLNCGYIELYARD